MLPKRPVVIALLVAVLVAALAPAAAAADTDDRGPTVVVANRGSGDLTVIDSVTLATQTIDLGGDAEPMYVNHDPVRGLVFVGDRADDSVVVLDDQTFEQLDRIAVAPGVFHQWLDPDLGQLWVVGDSSRTVSVVDVATGTVSWTIDIPADLVASGGVPHDVFVAGDRAFVSILGLPGDTGAVLQYSTSTFVETGRAATGGDPHLFVDGTSLYVASQSAGTVTRYRAADLAPLGSTSVPGAHGIFVTDRNDVLVTNLPGGGADAVWDLNRSLNRVKDVADTSVPVPHNVAVDSLRQLFVTHSGATADQVTVIQLDPNGFGSAVTVTAGTNPFGLAFVS